MARPLNYSEADNPSNGWEAPEPRRRPSGRMMSLEQYERWLRDNYAGWGDELEADGICSVEDAVGDVAESIARFPDADARAAIGYLRYSGVRDIKGRLADDLYDIAHR